MNESDRRQTGSLNDILTDLKSLLDENERNPQSTEDMGMTRVFSERDTEIVRNATRIYDERDAEIVRNASMAADKAVDYVEPQQPTVQAYNSDYVDTRRRERQLEQPRRMTQAQAQVRRDASKRGAPPPAAYDEEDYYEQEAPRTEEKSKKRKKHAKGNKKKRGGGCGCLTFLIVIVLLIVGAFAAFKFFGAPSKADSTKERKPGVSTVLIAGTDSGNMRTDTMMLVVIDEKEKTYNILSIPRDTLTYAPYSVPKINAAYGYYGGGESGMTGLYDLIEDSIGYRPDAYAVVNFESFADLVDVMGGLEFDVPMDMEVDGVYLSAGLQKLNGEQALAVVRYRSGYAAADLQRVQVQRQLINAALDQWVSVGSVAKLPDILSFLSSEVDTDLNVLNILWLGESLTTCEQGVSETLPGSAQWIGDGSYYVLDPYAVVELMNEYYNPFVEDITVDELNIKVG